MAEIPNRIATIPFAQITAEGNTYIRSTAVLDLDGAPIDLSGWTTIGANIFDFTSLEDAPSPIGSPTVTGNADGTMDLVFPSTLISSYKPATYQIVAIGGNAPGDALQVLARGQVQKVVA